MSCLFVPFRGQMGSCNCWTERMSHHYTRILIALSPHGPACSAPIHAQTRRKHGPTYDCHTRNSAAAVAKPPFIQIDRYTPDIAVVRRSIRSREAVRPELFRSLPSSFPCSDGPRLSPSQPGHTLGLPWNRQGPHNLVAQSQQIHTDIAREPAPYWTASGYEMDQKHDETRSP